MRFTPAIAAAILAFAASGVVAAPLPQLAGEGAACNSVLSQTDNGIGYGVENAEDNTANTVKSTGLRARQLAGEGAACDSVLSQTDNGIGYGVENAEDNTASLISGTSSTGTSTGGSSAPPPPPAKGPARRQLAGEGAACNSVLSQTDNGIGYGVENAEDNIAKTVKSTGLKRRQLAGEGAACNSVLSQTDNGIGYGVENAETNTANAVKSTGAKSRRQLDKIANGFGEIGKAAGAQAATDPVVQVGDSADGQLTSAAADAGAKIGDTEASILENAGKQIPKRQLDKIANGFGEIGKAAGAQAATDPVVQVGDSADGQLTSAAADAGAKIGDTEASTLEQAGSAILKRQLDKISNGAGAIADAAGVGAEAAPVVEAGDSVDGTLTGDAAQAGATVGDTEASILEQAGSAVPKL